MSFSIQTASTISLLSSSLVFVMLSMFVAVETTSSSLNDVFGNDKAILDMGVCFDGDDSVDESMMMCECLSFRIAVCVCVCVYCT